MSNNEGKSSNSLWDLVSNTLSQPHPAAQGLPVPPPPPPPNRLSQVFGRPSVNGLYYNGKTISLDGYQFMGCRFDNCTLLVSSTNFELVNCVIDASTRIQYSPEVLKVIQLFNSRSDWVYASAPAFAPRKNADGTITINGMSL